MLAFVRGWSKDRERPEDLAAMRACLKGRGAELTVLADSGVWSLGEVLDLDDYTDRPTGDLADAALLLGARTRCDTVYVLEGKHVSRYPLVPSVALSSTLAAALTPRAE